MRVARIPVAVAGAFIVAAMLLPLLAPAAGASSTPNYNGGCLISASKVTTTPGETIVVTATGFPVGALVTFIFSSAKPPFLPFVIGITHAKANAQGIGTATIQFRVPNLTRPGLHVITAIGLPPGQCRPSVSTNLMVLASTATPPATVAQTGTLPRTGTNSAELFQIALLLIAVGGLITLGARKRLAHARVES